MPIFLGIDGGGTKTTCALGDESSVLAIVHTEGSNVVRSGEAHARAALQSGVQKACAAAGVDAGSISSAYIGAAGAARPEVAAFVAHVCGELLHCPVQVVGDMVIAMQAAFGTGPGVITIAGTGSIAFGRNLQGVTARAGGWGYAVSDEGSGQWIGRVAARQALATLDEGNSSPLLVAILKDWPAESVDEFVRAVNAGSADFARVFPTVLALADNGEPTARTVLAAAGAELAELAKTVLHRLFTGQEHSVPVAMVGGVFRQSALVRQVFYNQVRAACPIACVNPTVVEPVLGALELARMQAGAASISR